MYFDPYNPFALMPYNRRTDSSSSYLFFFHSLVTPTADAAYHYNKTGLVPGHLSRQPLGPGQ